jgi:hypothetical protein
MASKLDTALQLAATGYYVFPLGPNSKLPLRPWREISSRNPKTISDWFICPIMETEQDINFGIDCGKSGLTVIDVDRKPGKEGTKTYNAHKEEHGWTKTFTVETPSGGHHLYYRSSDFRNTQGDKPDGSAGPMGRGIDTRGVGGFVVAPGSTIDGREYKVVRDFAVEPLPAWVAEKLTQHKHDPLKPRDSGKTIVADHDDDIEWAIDFLQSHEPAVEGQSGDAHTYQTFCILKEHGVSIDVAIELAMEHWNPRCEPLWDPADLAEKAESAYKSAQNATGAKSVHADFDPPSIVIPPKPRKKLLGAETSGLVWRAANGFPMRDWVIPGFALAKNVTLLIAPAGVGKSTFSLGLALSAVSGVDILGLPARERCAVAVFNNEDTKEEQERRIVAAAQHYHITQDMASYPDVTEKGSMLFVNGRDNLLLKVAKRDGNGALKPHNADAVVDYLIERNIRLLIVDPLSMTHEGSENSNEDMLVVGAIYSAIADKANCAIVLVHHTRKLSEASSEGHSGNLDSARGASSLGGVARVAFTLNVMSMKDAGRYGVPEHHRTRYLLLEQAKANMSAPGEHKRYFERYGEVIGITADNLDGESIGVLRPANLVDRTLEATNVATLSLIRDVEAMVEDGPQTIPAIARALVESFAMHSDKKPRSLEKAITRLFSEGILTGITGTLYLDERKGLGAEKPTRLIRIELNATAPTIDDLI